MTRKETLATIKALGLTARYADGEYRISISPYVLADAFKIGHREAMERNESLAIFATDSEEAIANAQALADWFARDKAARADREAPTKPAGRITLEPTWRACVPILVAALVDGTEEGKRLARLELDRMALAADSFNGRA